MTLNKAFAMRISTLLIKKNLSKYQLEKETGLTHSAMRYIFNEVNKEVKFSTVVKVAEFFDMSLSEFLNDDIFRYDNLDID